MTALHGIGLFYQKPHWPIRLIPTEGPSYKMLYDLMRYKLSLILPQKSCCCLPDKTLIEQEGEDKPLHSHTA